jgi:hypothetical protein
VIRVLDFKIRAIAASLFLLGMSAYYLFVMVPYCLNEWMALSNGVSALGIICNIFAVYLNGGKMPVHVSDETYLMLVGRVLSSPMHKFMDAETRCRVLV